MPKSLIIDPKIERRRGEINFNPIPLNAYSKTIGEEKENYSTKDFVRIYRDMFIIREFETMLDRIKTTGEYQGIKYNHPGPAHLSIGQEAAAVGMAYTLGVDDFIFGSHRSHGEILAKGLSAIHQLDEENLMKIMKTYFNGSVLKVVEKESRGSVKELAIEFLLYGTFAEIFARKTGFNKGLGGSMHAFFTPFGVYPNNAIVGGSGDIAVGAALYKKINRKTGIVVANIGDASMGCGPVWEGISFAAMDQFRTLWEGEFKGGLPIIFNFMNNLYGMGGQTQGETMGYGILARVGAGVNPDMMHAERIDGYNPLAVIDAFRRKRKILEENRGPVLLDTLTYRFSGHSPSDASSYRAKEEVDSWMEMDSVKSFGEELLNAGFVRQKDLEKITRDTSELVGKIMKLSINDNISPRMDILAGPELIGSMMFSNQSVDKMEDREPEVLLKLEDNPRVQQIKKRERFAIDKNGKTVSKLKV